MNAALASGNYQDIKDFYLFKICDSIIGLDLEIKTEKDYADNNQINEVKRKK